MVEGQYTVATVVFVAVVTILIGVGSLAPIAGIVSAQSSTIDSCTTIDSPGTYTLGSDIRNPDSDVCIRITASDVTLDGNGHTIAGEARWPTEDGFAAQPNGTDVIAQKGTEGIYASGSVDAPLTNVVVRNLTTTGWDNGTRYEYVDDGVIRGVTARNAVMNAIRVSNSDDNVLSNITLINNSEPNYDIPGGGHGLYITQDSTENTITRLGKIIRFSSHGVI